jgi:flagellar protein FliO/FliZ
VVSPTHVSGVSGLGEVTLALVVVLAAVFAFAWIVRRMRGLGNRVGNAIDVLADVPLGQKERAVLLKVGPTQILIGVAPGRVNTLHVLAEPLELSRPVGTATDSAPSFRSILMRSLGK